MKKKGFTLIELLAVIIILAVVALIATPIVLNVIDDARSSAALSEGNLVLKGINSYCEQVEMKKELGDGLEEGDFDCNPEENSTITLTSEDNSDDLAKMISNLDGDTTVSVTLKNGKVESLTVNSNTKEVVYNTETGKMEIQDDEEEPEETAYYEYGLPTTESSTNYQDVITSVNVFAKLQGEQLSVCIYKNNTLECFKNNNYEEEVVHLQNVFGADSCDSIDVDYGPGVECGDDDFVCRVYSNGIVYCSNYNYQVPACEVYPDGDVICV